MSDLISRQDALQVASEECQEFRGMYGRIEDRINQLPSPEPERKKGEWIDDGDPLTFKCDKCGYLVARYNNTNFCPNCGSYNGGEQE